MGKILGILAVFAFLVACGDVRFGPVKRCAAAVGEGSLAIAFVHQFLRDAAAQRAG